MTKYYRYYVGTKDPKQLTTTADWIIHQKEQAELSKLYKGKTN